MFFSLPRLFKRTTSLTILFCGFALAGSIQASTIPPQLHNNDGSPVNLPATLEYQTYQQVAVDDAGRITVAGKAANRPMSNQRREGITVVRYLANGKPDTEFLGNQAQRYFALNFNEVYNTSHEVAGVFPTADGGVRIASSVTSNGLSMLAHPLLLQLTSAGQFDSSFGSDGKVLINVGTNPGGHSSSWIARQDSSQRHVWFSSAVNTLFSLRTLADGSPDPLYAISHRGSIANLHPDLASYALPPVENHTYYYHSMQNIGFSGGNMYLALSFSSASHSTDYDGKKTVQALGVFDADGAPLNNHVIRTYPAPDTVPGGSSESVNASIVLPNNNYIFMRRSPDVKEYVPVPDGSGTYPLINIYISKLNSDQQLDQQFGSNGQIVLQANAFITPIITAVDNGQKFVIGYAGFTGTPKTQTYKVERYFANGQRDHSFIGPSAAEAEQIPYTSLSVSRLIELPNGKLLAFFGNYQNFNNGHIVRFNSDGTLDKSFNASTSNTITYTEGGTAVVLNSQAHINSSAAGFNGGKLVLRRYGGKNADDVFDTSGALTANGNQIALSGTVIGSVQQDNGELVITFNDNANQARINATLKLLTYSNRSIAPPANIDIEWQFTDAPMANTTPLSATSVTTIAITPIDSPAQLSTNILPVAFIEGVDTPSQAVAITPELIITDDAFSGPQTYSKAVINLSGTDSNDLLQLPTVSGFSAQYSARQLTITASGKSLSEWQTALRQVQFLNNSDSPITDARTASITLYDGNLASNIATKTINVTAMNDSPIISAPTSFTVTEDSNSALSSIAVSDPDAGSAALTMTLSVPRGLLSVPGTPSASLLNLNGSLTELNAKLLQLSYITALNDNTPLTLTISVTDNGASGAGEAKSASTTATLTITPINDAPEISGNPASSVQQDQSYQFTPTAIDVDNTAAELSFNIANKPAWLQFNSATGALTGTPSNDDVGDYSNITISVSDGDLSATLAPFSLTVINVNDPPSISGTPSTSAVEGEAYLFTPTAFDPDLQHGQVLAFSVDNLPSWASFDSATGTISGTPVGTDYGNHNAITIQVSDGELTALLPAFNIFVTRAPVVFTSHDFWGEQAKEHFGQALALFDADENGYSELIVGAPDRAIARNGKTLKQAGAINFITPAIDETLSLLGSEKKQRFGAAIAVVADQNQDGTPDLIIGNPKAGKGGEISLYSGADGSLIRVILQGKASKTAPIVSIMPLCAIDPDHIICRLLGGVAQGAPIGEVVATADVNGDGIDDLIVGLPQTTVKTPVKLNKAGTVIVYDGLSNTPIYTRSGTQAGELFGAAVSVNSIDQQLLVGSPMFDVMATKKIANAGRVQHFDLQNGSNAAQFIIEGSEKNQFFGDALASIEQDIDGDGQLDWLVAQPGIKNAAQVQLFSGNNANAFAEVNVDAPAKRGSIKLASGSDTNSDAVNDIAIGLPLANRQLQLPNGKQKALNQAGLVRLLSGHTWQQN